MNTIKELFEYAKGKLNEYSVQAKHEETKTILALGVLHHLHSVEHFTSILYNAVTSADVMLVYHYFLYSGEMSAMKVKEIARAHLKFSNTLIKIDGRILQDIMIPLVESSLAVKQKRKYVGTVLRYVVTIMLQEEEFSYMGPVLRRYAEILDRVFDVVKSLRENGMLKDAMREGTFYYLVASEYSRIVKEQNAEYNPFELTLVYSLANELFPREWDADRYVIRDIAMLF